MALADALALSGNATVDASTAAQLAGLANFSDRRPPLTVSDTAQALIDHGYRDPADGRRPVAVRRPTRWMSPALLRLALFGIKFSAAGALL